MDSFVDFLQRNTCTKGDRLPIVHTARSFLIRKFISTNAIIPQACDTFIGERLNYFFVGRPAYKYKIDSPSDFWMFPIAFVLKYEAINPSRVFPFDTGAFKRKILPQFINEMEMDFFEVSQDDEAPQKIVGTFFGTTQNYMNFKGLSDNDFYRAHELTPLDAEIHALHKLSLDPKPPTFDDRQFTIELQSKHDVFLTPDRVLAVVVPIYYLDDEDFVSHVENTWSATLLSYDLHPINPEYHYYAVYDAIKSFYQTEGII